jgi:ornithine--oxo-acid transaminase
MTAISMSVDPESRDNYGPYVPGVGAICPSTGKQIRFNNIPDLEEALEAHGKETAAFIVEPIQGEAGVVVPADDYLTKVQELCKKHNVLLICDEIQTGIGRTGKMLCSQWAGIKPDMVTLGKAISGGMYPVSCVLSSKEIMLTIEPGTHGSTYGGNPLGCAVSIRALEIMEEENLTERAEALGKILRQGLTDIKSPMIKLVRGKGLLNAIALDESKTGGHSAWDLCMLLKSKGLLAKPTHENIIRLAPPLVISEAEIREALKIIGEAIIELPNLKGEAEDQIIPSSEKGVHIGLDI